MKRQKVISNQYRGVISKEFWVEVIIKIIGLTSIVILVLIFLYLLKEGLGFFSEHPFGEFILGSRWLPRGITSQLGILPLVVGSAFVTFIAVIIAVPLGIGTAIFISEIAPEKLKEFLKPILELLATVPSVVFGFVGIIFVAPYVRQIFGLNTGLTAFTGGLLLAVMALPTVVSIAEDALQAVPDDYKEASYALGVNKWETVRYVCVPAARPGLIAASMLGLGRAMGETMTVLMVTGNAPTIPSSVFQPVRTMTATIAAEMGDAVRGSLHFQSLFAMGLVLFIISLVINITADLILQRGIREVGR